MQSDIFKDDDSVPLVGQDNCFVQLPCFKLFPDRGSIHNARSEVR